MSVGNERESCPPPVILTPRMKLLRDVSGTVSMGLIILCAVSISVLGESIVLWSVYIISAVAGVINNVLFRNKKMTVIFVVFTITNIVSIIRLYIGW